MMDSGMGYDGTTSTLTTAAANVWTLVTDSVNAGYLIAAGTSTTTVDGFVVDHAYTILNYTTLTNSTASYQLIKVRNPWGVDEDYGWWNDDDAGSWSTSFKNTAGFVNNTADGDSWVSVTDFVQIFDDIQVGYYNANFQNNYFEVVDDDSTLKYFNFTLTNSVNEVYVLMEFYNPRMYPYGCRSTSAYTTGSMTMYNSTGYSLASNLSVSDDLQNQKYIHYTSLPAGTYTIATYVGGWLSTDVNDFTVRVYGNVSTTITQ